MAHKCLKRDYLRPDYFELRLKSEGPEIDIGMS
jgi:hypothetical protein